KPSAKRRPLGSSEKRGQHRRLTGFTVLTLLLRRSASLVIDFDSREDLTQYLVRCIAWRNLLSRAIGTHQYEPRGASEDRLGQQRRIRDRRERYVSSFAVTHSSFVEGRLR